MAFQKTACPVSRSTFRSKAPRSIVVTIDGKSYTAEIKEFSTGSFGYYLNGKTSVMIDGVPVTLQVGMNLTVAGSKEAQQ